MRRPGVRPDLAAVVLAAGAGTRLRPLTRLRPKALCPVANVPLVDLALARVRRVTTSVAVNVHHGRDMLESYLFGGVHLSIEEDRALGTAGGLAHLRDWIAGRDVLVVNVDAWHEADLAAFALAWDGERPTVLVTGEPTLRAGSGICGALMPWAAVRDLPAAPAGLYEVSWQAAADSGRLDAIAYTGPFVDCGTPSDYLRANMLASGGAPVVGQGAVVEGSLVRSVVWPGGRVRRGEQLVDAIRVGDRLTVLVR
jgi:MurNAc alpha-1-phosphate uridylyltransferase